jgi:protein SCO1/2
MRVIIFLFAALCAASMSVPSLAHHPGQKLDQVMGSKERYFQAIDKKAPNFSLLDAGGRPVSLTGLRDKIVVLHFVARRAHCQSSGDDRSNADEGSCSVHNDYDRSNK